MAFYKGHCAGCNAHWNSKAFKSKPAGLALPPAEMCELQFAFESEKNNKICPGCYVRNLKQHKAKAVQENSRVEEEHGKDDEGEEGDMAALLLLSLQSANK